MRDFSLVFTGVLALVLVMVLAPLVYVPRIEADLGRRCRAALAEEGFDALFVTVDGRDVFLDGSLPSRQRIMAAQELVTGVWGVRRVVNRLGLDMASPAALTELHTEGSVEFEPGADLPTAASLRTLDRLVELLVRFPDTRIVVSVPAGPDGDGGRDLGLSRLRVEAVTDYLRLRGVAPGRYLVTDTEPASVMTGEDNAIRPFRVRVVEDG